MTTFHLLLLLAPIGALDVLYYHWYRFRLWARPASVAEEWTHLLRQGTFLAVAVLLAQGSLPSELDTLLLFLLGFDLVNSAIDVLLEPCSRASLGGLPRGELLLHYLGIFGSGAVLATYWAERGQTLPAPPAWQALPLIAGAALLLLAELGLFGWAQLRPRCCRMLPAFCA